MTRTSKEIGEEILRAEKEYEDLIEKSKAEMDEMDRKQISELQRKLRAEFFETPDYYLLKATIKVLREVIPAKRIEAIWFALDKTKREAEQMKWIERKFREGRSLP